MSSPVLLLSTGLTETQILGGGFVIGVSIAILAYLVYETTNKPPG